jgi:Ca2+-binding RTX toxin-like protein
MRRVLVATVLTMAIMPAASAQAGEIYASGDLFDFFAPAGEHNDVTVTPGDTLAGPDVATIYDAGAPLTGIGECVSLGTHSVSCRSDTPRAPWNFNLSDFGDNLSWVGNTIGISATIDGGPGNNTLTAPNGGSTIWGGTGNDVITGGAGVDTIHGGGGNDRVTAGLGQDWVTLGAGNSAVDVRDGDADHVTCTDGGKARVLADPFDTVSGC